MRTGELLFNPLLTIFAFIKKISSLLQNVVDFYIYARRGKYKCISHSEFCKKLGALYSVDALCQEIGCYELSGNVQIMQEPRYEVKIIANKYSLAVEMTKEFLSIRKFTI